MTPLRNICVRCAIRQTTASRRFGASGRRGYAQESDLPRIASPSFWASLVPKFLRRSKDPIEVAEVAKTKSARSKEWNPATIFLFLGIFVGSNAIQIIAMRNEMLNFSRKTDAKLSLLREIVQRVKNGEDVDVRKALGTGDPQHEAEWEEVVKELEETDMLLEGSKKREAKRAGRLDQKREQSKESTTESRDREGPGDGHEPDAAQGDTNRRPKFLM